jgi:hypothetical protein
VRKCGRRGRYSLASVADQIGLDGKLTDSLNVLTRDCPRKLIGHLDVLRFM